MLCLLLQVKAYCESQTRFKGFTIDQLFPDHVFPNSTPEDMRKSEGGEGEEEGWEEGREGGDRKREGRREGGEGGEERGRGGEE